MKLSRRFFFDFNESFVKKHKLPVSALHIPVKLTLFDGNPSAAGPVLNETYINIELLIKKSIVSISLLLFCTRLRNLYLALNGYA